MNQLVTSYVHGTSKRLAALVAAECSVDAVQVLQVFHQLPRVTETGPAFHALVNRSRGCSSRPETEQSMKYT